MECETFVVPRPAFLQIHLIILVFAMGLQTYAELLMNSISHCLTAVRYAINSQVSTPHPARKDRGPKSLPISLWFSIQYRTSGALFSTRHSPWLSIWIYINRMDFSRKMPRVKVMVDKQDVARTAETDSSWSPPILSAII